MTTAAQDTPGESAKLIHQLRLMVFTVHADEKFYTPRGMFYERCADALAALTAERDALKKELELMTADRNGVKAMNKLHRAELTALRAQLEAKENERLETQELHGIQLAAISTVSIQNTERSKVDRITQGHPYWTVAYGDVAVTVDREIKHRSTLTATRERLERAEAALVKIGDLAGTPSRWSSRDLLDEAAEIAGAALTPAPTAPTDSLCSNCGVGFILPSGVCDHCDTKPAPTAASKGTQ